MRGVLTDKIQEIAKNTLKRDITQKELRLYPYIDYCVKNAGSGWSYDKINNEERKILNKLQDEGHLIYSSENILITRDFYNYIQNVLAESYVTFYDKGGNNV